ncbi:MAG: S8 family serine peptidase, partial [Acidobacteriaceae bacterium]|nr:S8 family serine peptidase [Acidobacteriaceae bacterium]
VGSSSLVGHPGVIPVVACDRHGMVASFSNLGNTIGKRGLCAPGEQVTSLRAGSTQPLTWGGTSVAAPFVTAMAALLWSVFPAVRAFQVRHAMTQGSRSRHSIVPPLMDIWRAYAALQELGARRK